MRTGFAPLVNPGTSVRDYVGTPTDHARALAASLQDARSEGEADFHRGRIKRTIADTSYVPDQRYLTKVVEEHDRLQTATSPLG